MRGVGTLFLGIFICVSLYLGKVPWVDVRSKGKGKGS